MLVQPPPLPVAKNLRLAATLNLMLPGAGLICLGRRILGTILATAFLACFLALLVIFLVGYARYLSIALGDNLLEGGKIEEAGAAFHPNWLMGFTAVGGGIYLCSAVLFAQTKRRWKA
jgi:hypothetical protein